MMRRVMRMMKMMRMTVLVMTMMMTMLETEQSADQVGFRRGTGIDHALAMFESERGKNIEWNSDIWFV